MGKATLNSAVIEHYTKLKLSLFLFPLCLLLLTVLLLYGQDALSVIKYVKIQQTTFYFINGQLSQFPIAVYNLTQFGDALIFLSLLTPFIIYAPKIWEALLSTSIVTLIVSKLLKDFFLVPRPAQVFDPTSFKIVGEQLSGFNSLPSGHSITIVSTLTVLLFAFMPKKVYPKMVWTLLVILAAFFLSLTRVGVGAHHPLDVIIGGLVGYISGLTGIFISLKFKIWSWINNIKYYPIFIILFLICGVLILIKLNTKNLVICYLPLISLLFSLYKIIHVYLKK